MNSQDDQEYVAYTRLLERMIKDGMQRDRDFHEYDGQNRLKG